ncbi:MAG: phosphoribosylanthranilate isomerase [Cyanobacteria bacterium P01_F01_bin.153]
MSTFRVKICGLTQPTQAVAIARLGATTLGFIAVEASPRYIPPDKLQRLIETLIPESPQIQRVGVFANAPLDFIAEFQGVGQLTGIQLHGDESLDDCQKVRDSLPGVEIIKAIRVKDKTSLENALQYGSVVDALLLDAYRPGVLGGTGATLDWETLTAFAPSCPWLLAGGLRPDNIAQALERVTPHGIDLSSGVERSPGDKDLDKVAQLFQELRQLEMVN